MHQFLVHALEHLAIHLVREMTRGHGGSYSSSTYSAPPKPHTYLTVQNTSDDTVHVAFAQYQSDADEWSTRAWWTVDPQHARLFEVTYASGDPYGGWFYYHLRGKPIHGGLWIQTHKKVVGGGQEFWVPKSLDSDTFVSHSLQKPASFTERLAKVRFDAIEVAPGVGEEAYYNIYYNG